MQLRRQLPSAAARSAAAAAPRHAAAAAPLRLSRGLQPRRGAAASVAATSARRGAAAAAAPPPPPPPLGGFLAKLSQLFAPPPQKRADPAAPLKAALRAIGERSQRGAAGAPGDRAEVEALVDELAALGEGRATTTPAALSARWRLVWTSEQETLFIINIARFFGTSAGDVYQIVDIDAGSLQNVITFPPEGAFVVESTAAAEGPQRTAFGFTGAALVLPGGRELRLPPVGKGWFDTLYSDGELRVARDSRGDTLIVERDGPPGAGYY